MKVIRHESRNGSRTSFKLNFRHVIPLQKKQGLILWVCFCLIVGIAFLGAKLLEKCRKSRNQRNDRKVVTRISKSSMVKAYLQNKEFRLQFCQNGIMLGMAINFLSNLKLSQVYCYAKNNVILAKF